MNESGEAYGVLKKRDIEKLLDMAWFIAILSSIFTELLYTSNTKLPHKFQEIRPKVILLVGNIG